MSHLNEISPNQLKEWIDQGTALLIDVREPLEYKEEHISKAQLCPISHFDPTKIPKPRDKKIVFYCRSGKRSATAAKKWAEKTGAEGCWSLEGGIVAWKEAKYPVVFDLGIERKIEHQAYISAGVLILLGLLLAVFFSWWFLLIPFVIGCLLLASGLVGHCLLSFLLSALPYNR